MNLSSSDVKLPKIADVCIGLPSTTSDAKMESKQQTQAFAQESSSSKGTAAYVANYTGKEQCTL